MATVAERVKAVTARVLKLDPKDIQPQHSFTEDLGAESVQSIELVAMFEEEFGIEMDEDAALSVTTVGDAVKFIANVCKEQGVKVEL
ncbi:MAG: acyl carrier protein [Planctomycetes bacterium]|jgi:acyl carrier protein|nr:acyl carrier protein [Planctomycetota bacterium]